MATIFISYAQTDRERTRPLADFLKLAGYRVWWDVGLRPGDNFTIEIQHQIQRADHVIVVWSRVAAASFWVTAEVTYARSCGKPIMPLRFDDCTPPVPFNLLQTKDLGPIDRDGPEIVAALVAAGTDPGNGASALERMGESSFGESVLRKAQELARWEFIKGSSHPQHFRTFLARFPDGELADLATMRLESLRWEEVSRSRKTEELCAYVAEFPTGVKAPEVRRILERRERAAEHAAWVRLRGGLFKWHRKRPDRQLADYEQFLALHPSGDYAPQAREIAERHRREVELWRRAAASSDKGIVEHYLNQYPRGGFAPEAKAHLARLRRQFASSQGIEQELRELGFEARPEFPVWTLVLLGALAALLGGIGAHLGARSEFMVALPFQFDGGQTYYLLHPYPILIGIFVAVLIHEWGNRSWLTTAFAFLAILVFRSASQLMGLSEEEQAGFPKNSMLIGAMYCFGAWLAGFVVAPYMRRSVPVFFISIVIGALLYPDWPVALGMPFEGHETFTASVFFVACTMPIAYSLLRALPELGPASPVAVTPVVKQVAGSG